MNQVYIGRPELPVYIDPALNIGKLPEEIAKEARRVAEEHYKREHVVHGEAYTYVGRELNLAGPEPFARFRLRLHFCCGSAHLGEWNEEYRIIQCGNAIAHVPRVKSFSLPCH